MSSYRKKISTFVVTFLGISASGNANLVSSPEASKFDGNAIVVPSENENANFRILKPKSHLSLDISGRGFFSAYFGTQKQKNVYTVNPNLALPITSSTHKSSHNFALDSSKLILSVNGYNPDINLKYRFDMVMSGTTTSNQHMQESYITLQRDGWGELVMGATYGVESNMAIGGSSVAGGTGGIDGNFTNFLSETTGTELIGNVKLPGDTNKATKVTYYSPRYKGFQMGISYTPSTLRAKNKMHDRENVALGVDYVHEIPNDITISYSFVGLHGVTHSEKHEVRQTLKRKNTLSFSTGVLVAYRNFEFALGYLGHGDANKIMTPVAVTPYGMQIKNYVPSKAGKAWGLNTGVAYRLSQKLKLSLNFLHGQRQTGYVPVGAQSSAKAKATVVTGSANFTVARGMDLFLDIARHDLKNPDAVYEGAHKAQALNEKQKVTKSNKATTFILGTVFNF